MAGIGFELKKLFVGRGALHKMRAYAYASIVCSGTMLLAVILLIGIQQLAMLAGATESQREVLVSMIVYATLFSLLLTATIQTLISRYVSDMFYREAFHRIMPSLLGASLLLMVPGGIGYGYMLYTIPSIPIIDRVLDWILFIELIPVWLQMAYMTAIKDYRRILLVFAIGVGVALLLGTVLIVSGVSAQTALLLAMVTGYGIMLAGFTRVLLRYFPVGSGSVFAFIEWFSRAPELVPIGFLSMAGVFVHMVVMWFSPLGDVVVGPLRHASTFDAALFAAFLVTVPANVSFVVSVEVNFYQKYRKYFGTINDGGTLAQLNIARVSMYTVLKQEVFKLAQIQIFVLVVYIIFMRYLLETIGFTADMVAMFQVMSIGYSAYAIGNSVMLLQLYFDDRKGALLSCAVFFTVNLVVSLWTRTHSPLYYGLGIVAGGLAMYLAALPKLLRYVKNIDYHVFSAQPILARQNAGFWTRFATLLDRRAVRKTGETLTNRRETSL